MFANTIWNDLYPWCRQKGWLASDFLRPSLHSTTIPTTMLSEIHQCMVSTHNLATLTWMVFRCSILTSSIIPYHLSLSLSWIMTLMDSWSMSAGVLIGLVILTCHLSWKYVSYALRWVCACPIPLHLHPSDSPLSSVSSQWDVNHGDIYILVHFRGKRQGTLSLWRPWKSVEWGIMNWDVIMVVPYRLRTCTLALTPHGGLPWRG